MTQYALYRIKHGRRDFVVDVQADALSYMSTRVILPLIARERYPDTANSRINFPLEIDNKKYCAVPQQIAVVRLSEMEAVGLNLKEYDFQITQALDFLFHGF